MDEAAPPRNADDRTRATGRVMTVAAPSIREILVATDFSDGAAGALTIAGHYARALHARIHLLHVSPAAGTDVMVPLADVRAEAGPDVSIVFVGKIGDPAEEILRYAASHAIDVIAVGTHGRTGVSRVLVGSVAERVIREAPCPVLAVHTPSTPARSMPTDSTAATRPTNAAARE